MNSPTGAFFALVRRDVRLAYRRRGEILHPLMFFVVAVSLFVLATDPDPLFLRKIAAASLWVAALFATLLTLDSMFRQDFADDFLAQLLLSPHPAAVLVLAKVFAHWLVSGAPLLIAAPLFAAMLNLPWHACPELLLSLLLGTPAMSLLGALGSALTLAARHSGALLALLVLPLYIPILIFGSSAVRAAISGLDAGGEMAWLGAILLLALALTPAGIVAALRVSLH